MKTVLNIQAHEQVAILMNWILKAHGFRVVDARNAPETTAESGAPHVIILNTNIALEEKRACVTALRLIAPQAGIVDMSLDAENDDYDTGADQYLRKPFSAENLVARVRAAVREAA